MIFGSGGSFDPFGGFIDWEWLERWIDQRRLLAGLGPLDGRESDDFGPPGEGLKRLGVILLSSPIP